MYSMAFHADSPWSWIIWRITDPVETALYYSEDDDECVPLRDDMWEATALPNNWEGYAHIVAHVGRCRGYKHMIRVKTPCTNRELLTAIYDFYNEPIQTVEDYNDDGWDLRDEAIERLQAGEVVRRGDLNGNNSRYEGVRHMYEDIYRLLLGSGLF